MKSEHDNHPESKIETNRPRYEFTRKDTLIFVTGAPLSGKSTISPLITSSISGCSLQSMDILRLLAQGMESLKPQDQRNHFVEYGSCDSYRLVGDGIYTQQNLINGFNAYAEAVSSLLPLIIPKLESQGEQALLFEGVQLAPSLIQKYLSNNNQLVVMASDPGIFDRNRAKLFGDNAELSERYSTEKLVLLQEEIIRQARKLPNQKVFFVQNVDDPANLASSVLSGLLGRNVVKYLQDGQRSNY